MTTGATDSFGNYLLHERIGAGGMAEIFLASDPTKQPKRALVIKRILPNLSEDAQFVRMFVEEARLCVFLKHPNIVQVYDLGEIDSRYFIAMEYVHGRDLLKTLAACARKRIAFPTDLALMIVMEVLKALDYAHNLTRPDGKSLGIIHRDVSPSNVLLSFDGEVKLGDFGIAKATTREKTATGILKGKFGYMAPEQVVGREIDHRADVFAVGILLYELLTGHRLFAGRNELLVLEKVRDARIEPPMRHYRKDLDEELEQIVLTALAREVETRFQSTVELHVALSSYVSSHGVVVGSARLARFLQDLFLNEETEEHFAAAIPALSRQNGKLRTRGATSNQRGRQRSQVGNTELTREEGNNFFTIEESTRGSDPEIDLVREVFDHGSHRSILGPKPTSTIGGRSSAATDRGSAATDEVDKLASPEPEFGEEGDGTWSEDSTSNIDPTEAEMEGLSEPVVAQLPPDPDATESRNEVPSEVLKLRRQAQENTETELDLEERKFEEDRKKSSSTPYGGIPVVTVLGGNGSPKVVVEAIPRAGDGIPTELLEPSAEDPAFLDDDDLEELEEADAADIIELDGVIGEGPADTLMGVIQPESPGSFDDGEDETLSIDDAQDLRKQVLESPTDEVEELDSDDPAAFTAPCRPPSSISIDPSLEMELGQELSDKLDPDELDAGPTDESMSSPADSAADTTAADAQQSVELVKPVEERPDSKAVPTRPEELGSELAEALNTDRALPETEGDPEEQPRRRSTLNQRATPPPRKQSASALRRLPPRRPTARIGSEVPGGPAEAKKRVSTRAPLSVVNPAPTDEPRSPVIPVAPDDEDADLPTRLGELGGPETPDVEIDRGPTRFGVLGDEPDRETSSGVNAAIDEAAEVDAEIEEMRSLSGTEGERINVPDDLTRKGDLAGLVDGAAGQKPLAVTLGSDAKSDAPSEDGFSEKTKEQNPDLDAGRLGDRGASDLFGALDILDSGPLHLEEGPATFDPDEERSLENTGVAPSPFAEDPAEEAPVAPSVLSEVGEEEATVGEVPPGSTEARAWEGEESDSTAEQTSDQTQETANQEPDEEASRSFDQDEEPTESVGENVPPLDNPLHVPEVSDRAGRALSGRSGFGPELSAGSVADALRGKSAVGAYESSLSMPKIEFIDDATSNESLVYEEEESESGEVLNLVPMDEDETTNIGEELSSSTGDRGLLSDSFAMNGRAKQNAPSVSVPLPDASPVVPQAPSRHSTPAPSYSGDIERRMRAAVERMRPAKEKKRINVTDPRQSEEPPPQSVPPSSAPPPPASAPPPPTPAPPVQRQVMNMNTEPPRRVIPKRSFSPPESDVPQVILAATHREWRWAWAAGILATFAVTVAAIAFVTLHRRKAPTRIQPNPQHQTPGASESQPPPAPAPPPIETTGNNASGRSPAEAPSPLTPDSPSLRTRPRTRSPAAAAPSGIQVRCDGEDLTFRGSDGTTIKKEGVGTARIPLSPGGYTLLVSKGGKRERFSVRVPPGVFTDFTCRR